MSERRSEGSRRSRRPRCHRTPGYLWARLVSPVGVRCLAFLLLHLAALFPAVQRYPAPLAFQWRHLQDTALLSLPIGTETKDLVGRSRRVSPRGCNTLQSAAPFGVVIFLFAVMTTIPIYDSQYLYALYFSSFLPSFLGTQSRPKVNFLIWITR